MPTVPAFSAVEINSFLNALAKRQSTLAADRAYTAMLATNGE